MKRFLRISLFGAVVIMTARGVEPDPAKEPQDYIRREVVQVYPALINTSGGGPPHSFKKDATGKITYQEKEDLFPRVGDRIVIRGRYALVTQDKARITLIQTLKKKSKPLYFALPSIEVKKGSGDFEMTYDLEREGNLFLVLTSIPDGHRGPSMFWVETVRAARKGDLGPDKIDQPKPDRN